MTIHKLRFLVTVTAAILLQAALGLAQEVTPPASSVDRKFDRKELQEDFLVFRNVLEEAHPGLYRYTSKKVLDDSFDNAFKRLDREMTEREFFPIVASIVSSIKDGHMASIPSSEFMDYRKTFPLNLRFLGGKAYVVSSPNSTITPGSELLSINGAKLSAITRTIFGYLPGDGDIETGKYWRLNRRFHIYYNVFVEQPDSFIVHYKDAATGHKTKARLTPVIANEPYLLTPIDDGKPPVRLEFLAESNTALLTISTFSETAMPKAGQDYRQFMEAAFHEIKGRNIHDLIVDLRGNDGGYDVYGSLLFSYLTDKEFRYFDYIEASTNKITLAQYTDAGAKLDKMFAEDLMPGVTGRFRLKRSGEFSQQQLQQPQKNHFDGKVWFLINGLSFSTTADVCSIAHYHRRGRFVGEEVGGGYYGNNSGRRLRLTLPNTRVRITVPLLEYVNAVSGYPYPRRGVMPDYPVQPGIRDVLNGVDTELMFTRKLIKNGSHRR